MVAKTRDYKNKNKGLIRPNGQIMKVKMFFFLTFITCSRNCRLSLHEVFRKANVHVKGNRMQRAMLMSLCQGKRDQVDCGSVNFYHCKK